MDKCEACGEEAEVMVDDAKLCVECASDRLLEENSEPCNDTD